MKVSVAIATYRGSQFIADQLASIVAQTRPPEEIVLFDDASDDQTVEIVQAFAHQSSVTIACHRQSSNVRVVKNFESAIAMAKGDIIVLSDQDDVWFPHKLESIENVFRHDLSVGLVFSDAELVDQELRPIGHTLWESLRFTPAQRTQVRSPQAFDLLLRRFLVTGATMAFRRSHLDVVFPLSTHLIHDAWIALVIAAVSRIECIDEPLIQYRQHAGQQIGERGSWQNWRTQMQSAMKMSPEYFHEQRLFFRDLANRLDEHKSQWIEPKIGELAKQKLAHLERRIGFRGQRLHSLPAILSEFASGRYSRFSYGWKSVLQDLLL